jgi:hypothetical protein
MICVACEQRIEAGDYRLVGVEQGSWESRYAHQGNCEAEARERFAPRQVPPKRRNRKEAPPQLEIEELTMEEPEPFPGEELPWFGADRRR